MSKSLLEVNNLSIIHKQTGKSIVRDINFELNKGEVLGIVGESGSGKTLTSHSLLGILQESLEIRGEIIFEGIKIEDFSKVRGRKISIIFQDPFNALNPILKIKDQIRILAKSHGVAYPLIESEFIKLLKKVEITSPIRVLNSFPHQLSGGMLQRVIIAMILLLKPLIVIADEPTTSLDVTVQKEIIKLFKSIKEEFGISLIFITHDLFLAEEICDRILIMYSGYILEEGKANTILNTPLHPYTMKLISSIPTVNEKNQKLSYIPGRVPNFLELKNGCPFADRCVFSKEICTNT
ncbi:MAG: ABC transporter ATP-binding protein, partial [Brevinematia bacterium]